MLSAESTSKETTADGTVSQMWSLSKCYEQYITKVKGRLILYGYINLRQWDGNFNKRMKPLLHNKKAIIYLHNPGISA